MFKLVKVTSADAIKTAQAQFPKAVIKSGELEEEDGKLIYSFDLQQLGVKGIEEVTLSGGARSIGGAEKARSVSRESWSPAPP